MGAEEKPGDPRQTLEGCGPEPRDTAATRDGRKPGWALVSLRQEGSPATTWSQAWWAQRPTPSPQDCGRINVFLEAVKFLASLHTLELGRVGRERTGKGEMPRLTGGGPLSPRWDTLWGTVTPPQVPSLLLCPFMDREAIGASGIEANPEVRIF